MSKTVDEILAPKPVARPRIYAYSIADNAESKGNTRDEAIASQLVCLANLETLNAHFIRPKSPRRPHPGHPRR